MASPFIRYSNVRNWVVSGWSAFRSLCARQLGRKLGGKRTVRKSIGRVPKDVSIESLTEYIRSLQVIVPPINCVAAQARLCRRAAPPKSATR